MKRRAVVQWGMALALGLASARPACAQGTVTTVILVRHAEKAAEPAADPPLTTAGEVRAKALYDAVRDAGVTAIVTTQLLRTRATAQPTATALGITPDVVTAGGATATHAEAVAAAVRKHAGGTVLVVGHSNTIPAIIAALGAKQPAAICDPEYDGFYVVRLGDPKPGVIRSRYGEPSHLDATCGVMR